MEGVAKGRIGRKENNRIDNRCCYEKGNSRVTGDLLFQKTIDNWNDSTLARRKEKANEGTKKDPPPTIARKKLINFIRRDIDLNPPRNETPNQDKKEGLQS